MAVNCLLANRQLLQLLPAAAVYSANSTDAACPICQPDLPPQAQRIIEPRSQPLPSYSNVCIGG
jgi:hypothetical protein